MYRTLLALLYMWCIVSVLLRSLPTWNKALQKPFLISKIYARDVCSTPIIITSFLINGEYSFLSSTSYMEFVPKPSMYSLFIETSFLSQLHQCDFVQETVVCEYCFQYWPLSCVKRWWIHVVSQLSCYSSVKRNNKQEYTLICWLILRLYFIVNLTTHFH